MNSRVTLVAGCIGMAMPTAALVRVCSARPEFRPLGFLPGRSDSGASTISPDGRVVGGASGSTAFRWTSDEGMSEIGNLPFPYWSNAVPTGASDDGRVIVGYDTSLLSKGFPSHAFRWTVQTGITPLQPPPVPGSLTGSAANGVSWDGSVIVGYREFSACVWRDGVFAAIPTMGFALGVSGDGLCIVGSGPTRWTSQGGVVSLGDLQGGRTGGGATAASYTGDVIVGYGSSAASAPNQFEAFRWTSPNGMIGLGDLPGGYFHSVAKAVSSDGAIVVGEGSTEDSSGSRAFIWDEAHGMRELRQVLIDEFGLKDSLEGWVLRIAYGLSADGRTIVGVGHNPQGLPEAWVAYLGPTSKPCPADFDRSGSVDSQDVLEYLIAFFGADCCNEIPEDICVNPANFNHDHCVDSADFFDFLTAFFAGCP